MRAIVLAATAVLTVFTGCDDPTRPDPIVETGDQAGLRVAVDLASAPEVTAARLWVSAADIPHSLLFLLTMQNGVATGTAMVPVGPQRVFTLQALDASSVVRYEGSDTADVSSGPNPPLNIVLLPVDPTGEVPITGTIGSPTASVTLSPATMSLSVGNTGQLEATVRDAAGNVLIGRSVTWTTNSDGVATVDGAGRVTAHQVGTALIQAWSDGQSGAAVLHVTEPAASNLVASITVSAPATSMAAGEIAQLTATLRDASGNILTGRTITWTSNSEGVATVDGAGRVTAHQVGTALIQAWSEGRSGALVLEVTASPP